MAATAGVALLVSVGAANAQTPPASTNDKSDKTTQMNSAPSKESAAPKSGMSQKHATNHKARRHLAMRHHYRGTTTGAGTIGGPRNDPSIHQSIQRDSRGTPKGPGSDYNK
jgi:hypothetical protein